MTAQKLFDLPVYAPDGQYLFTCESLTMIPANCKTGRTGVEFAQVENERPYKIERMVVSVVRIESYQQSDQFFGILQSDAVCRDLQTVLRIVKDPNVLTSVREQYGSCDAGIRFVMAHS